MVSTRTTTAMLIGTLVFAATPALATGWERQSQYPTAGRPIGALDEAMTSAAPTQTKARHHARRQHVQRERSVHHRLHAHAERKPANWRRMQSSSMRRHDVAANAYASANSQVATGFGGGGGGVVAEARRYLGGNPTGRSSLWCGHFMNLVLQRSGHRPSQSNTARSFASYGTRISGPQVGAIAVMSRGKRGGHVGIVSGIDPNGNPIIISGNHNRRVAETVYPRGRIHAYVMP